MQTGSFAKMDDTHAEEEKLQPINMDSVDRGTNNAKSEPDDNIENLEPLLNRSFEERNQSEIDRMREQF